MILPVDVSGQKVDVLVVDVFKVNVLEVAQMRRLDKMFLHYIRKVDLVN
jgi:hypothetical protein